MQHRPARRRTEVKDLLDVVQSDLWHSCALWTAPSRARRLTLVAARLLLVPRVRAVVWFRCSQLLFSRRSTSWIAYLVQARILSGTGAELHPGATIGPGLNLAHTAGIVIGRHTVIGKDALIFQNVTLGDDGTSKGQPAVGDKVQLGAGAKVLGAITIGDEVIVGANAVVVRDIASGCVAVGVPASERPRSRATS